jgi:5-aminopentanamidase
MKVAAYQAPLHATQATGTILGLVREQVERCELEGVEILCCPEGVLGGLADYAPRPADIAIDVEGGELDTLLAPLASGRVATIVGFTEIGPGGRLYNAAAVYHRGSVAGIYRKLHPAIRRSVYAAGDETPVFTVGSLTFGIVICRDSAFPEPPRMMAARGAAALFIPTNNGLPPSIVSAEVAADARKSDIARAVGNGVSVVRADVAGRCGNLESWGSSAIVDPHGVVLKSALPHCPDLIVADIDITPPLGDPA